MTEPVLTHDAKVAIRSYMLKLALPSGAVIGVLASILTYLVQDVAASRTTIEVYDKASGRIQELLIKAADANAKADTARQKIKDSELEVTSLKSKIISAQSEIDVIVKKTKDSAVLASSNKSLQTIASQIGASEEFIKQVQTSNAIPIGVLVSSLLGPTNFLAGSNVSNWIPADGRSIPRTSKYYKLSGKDKSPDMRGMFIRGLNEFEGGQSPRQDGLEDPDGANRIAGDFQRDAISAHNHSMGVNGADTTTMVPGGATQRLAHFKSDQYGSGSPKRTNQSGGKETRPKNVAVYYYLKVN